MSLGVFCYPTSSSVLSIILNSIWWWGSRSLLPGPLWAGVVIPIRVTSLGLRIIYIGWDHIKLYNLLQIICIKNLVPLSCIQINYYYGEIKKMWFKKLLQRNSENINE